MASIAVFTAKIDWKLQLEKLRSEEFTTGFGCGFEVISYNCVQWIVILFLNVTIKLETQLLDLDCCMIIQGHSYETMVDCVLLE